MPFEKRRITVNLDDDDYQWVLTQSEQTGHSRAGILRQLVRAVRLGQPALLEFGDGEWYFAEDGAALESVAEDSDASPEKALNEQPEPHDDEGDGEAEGEPNEAASGIEAFRTD